MEKQSLHGYKGNSPWITYYTRSKPNPTGKSLWLKVGNYVRLLQKQVYLKLGYSSNSLDYLLLELRLFLGHGMELNL